MRLRRYGMFLCSRTGPPAHIPCQFNTKPVFTFRLLSLPSKSLYPHTLADHFYVRRHPQVTILTLHQSSFVSRQFNRLCPDTLPDLLSCPLMYLHQLASQYRIQLYMFLLAASWATQQSCAYPISPQTNLVGLD